MKAYKDICPCKECKERTFDCHIKCAKYNEWKSNGIEIKIEPFFDFRKHKRR